MPSQLPAAFQEQDTRRFLRNAYAAVKVLEPAPAQAVLERKK